MAGADTYVGVFFLICSSLRRPESCFVCVSFCGRIRVDPGKRRNGCNGYDTSDIAPQAP